MQRHHSKSTHLSKNWTAIIWSLLHKTYFVHNEMFCAISCYCTKKNFLSKYWLVYFKNLPSGTHPEFPLCSSPEKPPPRHSAPQGSCWNISPGFITLFYPSHIRLLKRDLVLNSPSTFFEVLLHLVQLFLPASEDRTMAAGAEEKREDGLARGLPCHLSHQPWKIQF